MCSKNSNHQIDGSWTKKMFPPLMRNKFDIIYELHQLQWSFYITPKYMRNQLNQVYIILAKVA